MPFVRLWPEGMTFELLTQAQGSLVPGPRELPFADATGVGVSIIVHKLVGDDAGNRRAAVGIDEVGVQHQIPEMPIWAHPSQGLAPAGGHRAIHALDLGDGPERDEFVPDVAAHSWLNIRLKNVSLEQARRLAPVKLGSLIRASKISPAALIVFCCVDVQFVNERLFTNGR